MTRASTWEQNEERGEMDMEKKNQKYAQGRRGESKMKLKLKRTQLKRIYYNI